MKCEIIIDSLCDERVVVYARTRNALVEEIEKLTQQSLTTLLGYKDSEIVKLNITDIHCISVISNKVYAILDGERYLLKERLYSLAEKLPDFFVKINQSCIANLNKIERFDASISGTLKLQFKNGYTDFVSRRQLKFIKERIGI